MRKAGKAGTIKTIESCHATNAPPLILAFDREFDPEECETLDELAEVFHAEASRITDAMLTHLPQGLTDRILAQLCSAKAQLFIVPQRKLERNHGCVQLSEAIRRTDTKQG